MKPSLELEKVQQPLSSPRSDVDIAGSEARTAPSHEDDSVLHTLTLPPSDATSCHEHSIPDSIMEEHPSSNNDGIHSKPKSCQVSASHDVVNTPKVDSPYQRSRFSEHGFTSNLTPDANSTSPAQILRNPRLNNILDGELFRTQSMTAAPRSPSPTLPALRRSSLRNETRPSRDEQRPPARSPVASLRSSYPNTSFFSEKSRPYTRPSSQTDEEAQADNNPTLAELRNTWTSGDDDPWRLPSLPLSRSSTPNSSRPEPRPSFKRLTSLDNLMTYREEKADWKRASSLLRTSSAPSISEDPAERPTGEYFGTFNMPNQTALSVDAGEGVQVFTQNENRRHSEPPKSNTFARKNGFRHAAAEIGFCFTIAMTQFLAEYLISGFAVELPNLLARASPNGTGTMGIFWPASLLSLILSATLLIFARLSDMYSGYFIFMFGVAWLAIWTLIPGFCTSIIMLDVSRAMQGLAIAAFMPSTFAMVGSIYSEGPRKNIVMGLYSGCAPLGFFSGFLVAGALPEGKSAWYFWIASALCAISFVTAYLSVPSDRTDRQKLGLKMDWIGAFLITSGLILVVYALSAEPYANHLQGEKSGFGFPTVYGPLASGFACLVVAFWYEGWSAKCPLMPFDFFQPRSVKALSLACLCFYASYGVWLYNSAQYLRSPSGTTGWKDGMPGLTLALWYTPTAVAGIILCIVGGALMHIVPIMVLLMISALAWILAPVLLAVAPLPLSYWNYVMPSMLCATIGIDLTFTLSIVFFSSVQPLRYQGLSGAVCSILVNLAMSFALSISGIVMKRAEESVSGPGVVNQLAGPLDRRTNWGYQATFIYAAASAGLGLIICVLFVRISRSVVSERPKDEESLRPTPSDTTLVDVETISGNEGREEEQGNTGTLGQSKKQQSGRH